ncbi:CoA transferase [Vibrio mediterranei]|uniref:CoA transferase n=1 Tax=Vibrio mediterranei TaxID=689 RepID=UPI00228419B9|nr:CoA transferase [Vibrio mediterranei]MCY9854141.1 CoA transferase [Vibrio mediterranei]
MTKNIQNQITQISKTLSLSEDTFLGKLTVEGQDPVLRSPHYIGESTATLLALFGMELSATWYKRTGAVENVSVDVTNAVTQLGSIFFNRQNGTTIEYEDKGLVGTTDFFKCKDGRWVYIVCSTPSLRQKTCSVLNCQATKGAFEKACLQWDAADLEEAILNVDGACSMVLTREEWHNSEQFPFTMKNNLIQIDKKTETSVKTFTKDPQKPLSGIKVLDNTHILAGPLSGRYLADAGADVLRILPPSYTNPVVMEMESIGGKHSTWLDLKKEDKKQTFFELIKDADVFLNSYLNLEGMGITPESLMKINPSLVYVDLTAYGKEGPWANRGGFEQHGQSVTGFSLNEGSIDQPANPPTYLMNDVMCGLEAAIGTVDALRQRAEQGGGYHVQISLSRNCDWVQEFGTLCHEEIRHLPESLINNPGLDGTLREEFCLPTHTTPKGPLGEMSFLPLQIEFSSLHIVPEWSGEPNGASKPTWDVFKR